MDEQYELISKTKIQEYKDEIARLKKELELSKKQPIEPQKNQVKEDSKKSLNETFEFKELLVQIQENTKKEQEKVLKELDDIKSLNKKTLDNVLSQNQEFQNRYDQLIDTLKHLTSTLTEVLDELPSQNSTEISTLLSEIKISLENKNHAEHKEDRVNTDPEILAKLDDIEIFMKNLRILLSYVKPNDLTIKK